MKGKITCSRTLGMEGKIEEKWFSNNNSLKFSLIQCNVYCAGSKTNLQYQVGFLHYTICLLRCSLKTQVSVTTVLETTRDFTQNYTQF
jgi:hypothetical protein